MVLLQRLRQPAFVNLLLILHVHTIPLISVKKAEKQLHCLYWKAWLGERSGTRKSFHKAADFAKTYRKIADPEGEFFKKVISSWGIPKASWRRECNFQPFSELWSAGLMFTEFNAVSRMETLKTKQNGFRDHLSQLLCHRTRALRTIMQADGDPCRNGLWKSSFRSVTTRKSPG